MNISLHIPYNACCYVFVTGRQNAVNPKIWTHDWPLLINLANSVLSLVVCKIWPTLVLSCLQPPTFIELLWIHGWWYLWNHSDQYYTFYWGNQTTLFLQLVSHKMSMSPLLSTNEFTSKSSKFTCFRSSMSLNIKSKSPFSLYYNEHSSNLRSFFVFQIFYLCMIVVPPHSTLSNLCTIYSSGGVTTLWTHFTTYFSLW